MSYIPATQQVNPYLTALSPVYNPANNNPYTSGSQASAPPVDMNPTYPVHGYVPQVQGYAPQVQTYIPPTQNVVAKDACDQAFILLSKAEYLSNKILHPKTSSKKAQPAPVAPINAAPINIDMSDRSIRMFNNETHHHYQGPSNQSQRKGDDGRVLMGLAGLGLAGATAYYLGKSSAKSANASMEETEYNQSKTLWSQIRFNFPTFYQNIVDRIINHADAIYQKRAADRTHKTALLILGFISGILGIAYAFKGDPFFFKASLGLGCITAVAALFKLGSLYSKVEKHHALRIQAEIVELRRTPLTVI